jgi:hypothetical protein
VNRGGLFAAVAVGFAALVGLPASRALAQAQCLDSKAATQPVVGYDSGDGAVFGFLVSFAPPPTTHLEILTTTNSHGYAS